MAMSALRSHEGVSGHPDAQSAARRGLQVAAPSLRATAPGGGGETSAHALPSVRFSPGTTRSRLDGLDVDDVIAIDRWRFGSDPLDEFERATNELGELRLNALWIATTRGHDDARAHRTELR